MTSIERIEHALHHAHTNFDVHALFTAQGEYINPWMCVFIGPSGEQGKWKRKSEY